MLEAKLFHSATSLKRIFIEISSTFFTLDAVFDSFFVCSLLSNNSAYIIALANAFMGSKNTLVYEIKEFIYKTTHFNNTNLVSLYFH